MAEKFISFVLFLAIHSVVTNSDFFVYASTEKQNDPEDEAEKLAEEGITEVYDDDPNRPNSVFTEGQQISPHLRS